MQQFQRYGFLYRSEYSRFSYIHLNEQDLYLYIDGEETKLTEPLQHLAPLICDHRQFEYAKLKELFADPATLDFFTHLTNTGKLWFADA
jgi:hypothetical protein